MTLTLILHKHLSFKVKYGAGNRLSASSSGKIGSEVTDTEEDLFMLRLVDLVSSVTPLLYWSLFFCHIFAPSVFTLTHVISLSLELSVDSVFKAENSPSMLANLENFLCVLLLSCFLCWKVHIYQSIHHPTCTHINQNSIHLLYFINACDV